MKTCWAFLKDTSAVTDLTDPRLATAVPSACRSSLLESTRRRIQSLELTLGAQSDTPSSSVMHHSREAAGLGTGANVSRQEPGTLPWGPGRWGWGQGLPTGLAGQRPCGVKAPGRSGNAGLFPHRLLSNSAW